MLQGEKHEMDQSDSEYTWRAQLNFSESGKNYKLYLQVPIDRAAEEDVPSREYMTLPVLQKKPCYFLSSKGKK